MSNKCLLRVQDLLTKSSITAAKKDEIINYVKLAQAERNLSNIDDINVDTIAKEVTEQIKLQRKIDQRNALENEIKARDHVEYIMTEFADKPAEGLISILVGSNRRVRGARASVASQKQAAVNGLISGFSQKLKDQNLELLFRDADKKTQRRIAQVMEDIGLGLEPREHNQEILKLGRLMEEYSEDVRKRLNDRGANISKLWGYIVRQSHDPFLARDAAKILGRTDINGDNYTRNFVAWKEFIMSKLDKERTFAGVDDIDNFMQFAYQSVIKNQNLKSDGAEFTYGSYASEMGKNAAQASQMKRVFHFKSADDWFDYNDKFGLGSLTESFHSGLQTAGRNMGIIDTLGTKPAQAYLQILNSVRRRLISDGKSAEAIKSDDRFLKYLKVVDGSIYSVENFAGARYSAIARAIASMAKLGGATISAISDIGIYGSEMRFQGRSFLSGMAEALGNLAKLKNSKQKKDIAEMLGFIADNTIYDVSARYQLGDPLSAGFTKAQRFFFKANLLSWWTNSLKEGAMLGMANYFAKQKNIKFNDLNPQLKSLFNTYDINEVKWDVIRKTAMETSDDGKEFINIGMLDKISDAEIKRIVGRDNLSARELQIEKEKFKMSVSGILLDRTTYAVLEPDAKIRGILTQGTKAGTIGGEALRFITQFKAFPMSVMFKTIGRDLDYFKGPNKDLARGIVGLSSLLLSSILLGYVAMTAKDIAKGRSPRDPLRKKTIMDAAFQGGGLGLYGDILFQETRSGLEQMGSLLGPVPLTGLDMAYAITSLVQGDVDQFGKSSYKAVMNSIPFLNLFYVKNAFDSLIGYQIMEYMNPGVTKRMEQRMRRDYDQEFIFGGPN
jgi:hypothetical protein